MLIKVPVTTKIAIRPIEMPIRTLLLGQRLESVLFSMVLSLAQADFVLQTGLTESSLNRIVVLI